MGEALDDDRSKRVPDSSYSRLEFFIIGQQNIWAALPLNGPLDLLSHYSDVIALGNYARINEAGSNPYFRVESIYTIELSDQGGTINKISNTGSGCD